MIRKTALEYSKHNPLRSEKGIALVMVLVLSAMALAIMAALIYMLTAGTIFSGMQKRYKTAIDAASGGSDVIYQYIAERGNPNIPDINFAFTLGLTADCLEAKLNDPTGDWPALCNSSMHIDPNDITTYDMTFTLGVAPLTYTVYSKIVDTVRGNSGGDIGLTKSGVVNSNSGEILVQSIPYLYTIEVDAQNAANPTERGKLSILYLY